MPAISAQGDEIQIEGEGPIGCLAACANACLAHLLRTSSTPALAFPQSTELFVAIAHSFQEICQSPHRVIRAFAMEPIFSLHKTLVQHALECEEGIHPPLDPGLQDAVVELFVRCAMSLAIACGYSADYFQDFGAMSDEDLEIERNDVRDVIRTVAVSERGGSTAFADVTRPPLEVTLKVLARLLHACFESIDASRKASQLFHETAVHCYSALAKSLNQLSKFYAKTGQPSVAPEILGLALQIMTTSLQIVIEGFTSSSLQDLFPVSRIANLAIAALSPMMSNLCTIPRFEEDVKAALRLSLSVAAMSVAQIPELATSSELGNATYDIRGAARGPGGEDHVGCLAIMRLTFESEQLAGKLIEAAGTDISQLGQLHSQLKSIEVKRGKGIVHGEGSTPTSRRILLGVICHLEIVSKGSAGCSSMLTEIFHNAFSSIASFANSDQSYLDDDKVIFQICESTWDLAAFSPIIVESLFASEGEHATTKLDCLRVLTKCICRGYERPSIYDEGTQPAAVIMVAMEWNRLRAGFFALLKTSISAKMPQTLFESVEAIIRSECEAAQVQCQAGPSSGSSIFNDEVVSAEHIPAGLFVRIIQEMIESLQEKPNNETALGSCVTTLERVKPYVLGAVTHPCQDPQCFADPRPALFEAWFLVMATLSNKAATLQVGSEATLRNLLVDSCVAAISLLFSPFLSKTRDLRSQSPCLSFEGPQTLALMEFLCSYFALGPAMLQPACHELIRRFPIDTAKANQFTTDVQCHSVAIIGAALYRVAQGALPPWSVESIHEVYAALFLALNRDVNAFGSMLHLGMEIRLAPGANRGGVKSEELLSGPLFEGVKQPAKQRFVQESVELCKQDNNGAWKRMKVLLKKFCGGKKIGTDFAQKSSPTNWLFERV
ncbi:hypothetical protein SEMRO_1602_G285260.1 [Seminavis robusta]|uniref:Uncharacterized protein n=1 Tax=Seminavis robusta TaxID=568900 RepID=A0A9N8HTK1_9STRA|nr:hypothetical protein SEMRO_1602_G285260.1 [Seminavis robusta]|eukprot:Sro1602_g285260.1 n/a (893) ;mRNA; r:23186-26066